MRLTRRSRPAELGLRVSLLDRLQFGFARDLPLVLHAEGAECGLACLAMIAQFHGGQYDLAGLRRRFRISAMGMTVEHLMQAAAALEFSPRALRLDMDFLRQLRLPCILHWGMTHYVVLKYVGRRKIVIHDPAHGMRNLSHAEVSRSFTGIALELSPNRKLAQPRQPQQQLRLWEMMGKVVGLPGSLVQIFLLAAAIEVVTLVMPFFIQWMTDHAIVTADRDLILALALGFALLAVVRTAFEAVRGWAVLVMSTLFNLQWMANVFSHLTRLPILYFERRQLGDIVNRFGVLQTIQNTLTVRFIEALVDGMMAFGTLAVMLIYSPPLASIGIAAMFIYALLRWLLYQSLRTASYEEFMHLGRQQSIFMETVRGIQSIRLANREDARVSRWLNALVDERNAGLRKYRQLLIFRTANSLLFGVAGIAVIALGAWNVVEGRFSVGMLLAFAIYSEQFGRRVSGFIDRAFELRLLELQGMWLADIVFEKPEQDAAPQPAAQPAPDGALEVRGMRFRYGEAGRMILEGVQFKAKAGECLAIVGSSGCGKTTLFRAVLGLFPQVPAEISIGGVSIKQLGMRRFRDLVGAAMQDDKLFAGTVADNISMFSAEPDYAAIEEAAGFAGVHDEIAALPMGYHTLIGDIGPVLSGGQRQRVFIARALYRRPKFLFLDEATSDIDVAKERQIHEALKRLGITRILSAHRPETVMVADRVLLLQGGKLTEMPQRSVAPAAAVVSQLAGKTI